MTIRTIEKWIIDDATEEQATILKEKWLWMESMAYRNEHPQNKGYFYTYDINLAEETSSKFNTNLPL